MFGSRKTVGAAIIPAIAPSTAASPHPSASIHPTRTPTSLLVVGLIAEARIASPSGVRLKNAHSSATVARQTQNVPTSCDEIATPPTSHVVFGNGLSNALPSAPPIHPAAPLSAIRRPIVTITIANADFCSNGRMIVRSIAAPPVNAIASVSRKAGQ